MLAILTVWQSMKRYLDGSSYEYADMGDAFSDIPKNGGDFGKPMHLAE
ncbi:MAG: hypothetical protein IPN42_04565 [Methylococcaceae bacterium]|nr:hypothetical protein [Methylococcaceae bacterium]